MSTLAVSDQGLTDDPEVIRKRIQDLEAKDAQLAEKLDQLTSFVDQGKADLNQRATTLIGDLMKIAEQIEYIQQELIRRQTAESMSREDLEEMARLLQEQTAKVSEEATSSDEEKVEDVLRDHSGEEGEQDVRKRCKKLYQRIAQKTHPDKCPDRPDLHKIFIEAKQAYRALDEYHLNYLLTCMTEMINQDSLEFMKNRLLRMENTIRSKMRIISFIMQDEDTKIIQMFRSTMTNMQDHAVYLYRMKILRSVDQAKKQLDQLIKQTGIMPKA